MTTSKTQEKIKLVDRVSRLEHDLATFAMAMKQFTEAYKHDCTQVDAMIQELRAVQDKRIILK
jgi:hypothetical protein